ncbi:MAG: amidase [Polyangiales bacterium]
MAGPQFAFVPKTRVARPRLCEGALSGLTFAVKDSFDIRGHRSSAGHPAWARTHEPARRDAPVVEQLRRAGADLVGVTILDELAYSLSGENPHFGTPQNPRAEGRLCGGSSCGSAAAVAAWLCDFAIGTDTAGSVRVPASYCGLFGLRPTHGAIDIEGVVPLAPSFDTVGLLARDPHTFGSVASVLLGHALGDHPRDLTRVIVAEDALALCDAGVAETLLDQLERALKLLGLPLERTQLAPEGFENLRLAQQRLSAREAWAAHGAWITAEQPDLSPPIAARFARARALAEDEESLGDDEAVRTSLQTRLREWLTPGTLLFLPPAPGIAPKLDASHADLEQHRTRTLELTSIASLSGAPQLVVPTHALAGAPLGLSFLSAPDTDTWLAQLALTLDGALAT